MGTLGISEEKQKEILGLIEKQKKAKISWVAIISQVSEDQLRTIAPDLGLIINKDEIMLSSETKEGKQATMVHANYEKLIHYAIEERVIRLYDGGFDNKEVKAFATSVALTAVLGVFGAALGGSLRIASYGKPTDPTKMKFGNVDTTRFHFDGRIETSSTKSNEMEPIKEYVYQEITELFPQTSHYLVPIQLYCELITLHEPQAQTLTLEQKNLLISLSNHLDIRIRDFCSALLEKSIVTLTNTSKEPSYQLLLITGEKIDCSEKSLLFNKISIYLSYRTRVNQIYYELVQQKKIPNLLDFILYSQTNYHQTLDMHAQFIFEEFVKYLTDNNLTENVSLVHSLTNQN